ncbi:MAG: ornithine cyclodeaminase family protein, partial [Halobacteriales archaeon]
TDLQAVRIYSPSDSRRRCARDLAAELGADVRAVDSPAAAVEGANAVVTATTATEPVFPADRLAPGAVVVAVGAYTPAMQELEPATFERADARFADVPAGVAETGDAVAAGLDAGDFAPLSAVLAGDEAHEGETVVVESVGTAVLDAATAEHVYERAVAADVGTVVEL